MERTMKLSPALDRLTPVVAAIALLSSASLACAHVQEPPKVEVTASKRTQLVTDVPYSITAIGGSEIADRGVTDIQQVSVGRAVVVHQRERIRAQAEFEMRRASAQGVGYGAALVAYRTSTRSR
jgi:hypothetical protein